MSEQLQQQQAHPAVLVVDDEANIRLMLRAALESEGYRIVEAADGREALGAVERERPAVALLDLSMPGMDGMTFLGHLASVEPAIRPAVVVLTAYGSIGAAVRAMKLGARDFLEKPATPDEVRAAVESAIVDRMARPPAAAEPTPDEPDYDRTLALVREALRAGEMHSVERMLMRAGAIAPDNDAVFLNLAGVFHEASGRGDAARKFYGRAIRSNPHYAPAQQNMRRLYELSTLGSTTQQVALGDEFKFLQGPDAMAAEGLLTRLKKLLAG